MKRIKQGNLGVGFVFAMLVAYGANAQGIDTNKMDRDLEVSKNILQTLFNQGNDGIFWGNSVDANYLEGYGVIFTIPNNYAFSVSTQVVVGRSFGRNTSVTPEVISLSEFNSDSVREANFEKAKENIRIFLTDYANLIGQLKPDDRIKIQNKNNSSDVFYLAFSDYSDIRSSASNNTGGYFAEVQFKDISAYKSGKISKSEFEKRILFEKSKPKEKIQDLELFASIMKRLYSTDLSETFFMSNTPRYERMDNYGAIFYMKTYSSYSERNLYRMPSVGRSDVTSEERKELIIDMYPKFEKDMKRNMLDYGRTISSLDANEVLSLNITITRCKGCSIPKSIVLTVPASVLQNYSQGKITIDKALTEVDVKKNMN